MNEPKRGDFGVIFDGDKPIGINIYLQPDLSVCIRLDGTLMDAGPINLPKLRVGWWPGKSQGLLAQVTKFGVSFYQPPAQKPVYGIRLDPAG